MTDPRLRVLDATGRRRWVEAARIDHDLLASSVDADVIVTGTKATQSVDGHAIRDLDLSSASTLLVRDPDLLDRVSVGSVAAAMADADAVVLAGLGVDSPLRTHVDLVVRSRSMADDDLGRFVEQSLGVTDDDVLAAIAGLTGGEPHLVVPLVDRLRSAEIELPGSARDVLGERTVLVRLVDGRPVEDLRWLAAAGLASHLAGSDRFGPLRADGLVDSDGVPPPAVAAAALAVLPAPARSELVWAVVEAAESGRLEPVAATRALVSLGPVPLKAVETVVEAARSVWDTAPTDVLAWTETLPHEGEVGILRVMALALVGRHGDALALADRLVGQSSRPEPRMVTAAGLAHGARFEASATTYDTADPDDTLGYGGTALAATPRALIGTQWDRSEGVRSGVTTHAALELADAAASLLRDSDEAVAALSEAAELAESSQLVLWPDTPHALAAVLASARLDHDGAARWAGRAVDLGLGGAAHRRRHRAIAGWVAYRSGRWADAIAVVDDLFDQPLSLRDRFLVATLDLSVRRASSEFADFDGRLTAAVELVRRHPLDLTSVFSHGAVARASARMGRGAGARTLLDQLDAFTASLPADPWRRLAGWERVGAGLVAHDAELAREGADRLSEIDPDSARGRAAGVVASALEGAVDPAEVDGTIDELIAIGSIVDAALLASAAALALTPTEAKPLLGRARVLRGRLPSRDVDEASGVGALSDRELDVAYELIAGHRYKDIGERLFISAKTVEHHVANIKSKLGSGSRAEMLAALRSGLE